MPQVSTSGATNIVRTMQDVDTTFSRSDAVIVILTMTAPRNVFLPGPATTGPGNTPTSGDYYAVQDPFGLVTTPNPLTIHGGGFNIVAEGVSLASIELDAIDGGFKFTFVQPPPESDIAPFWSLSQGA
jgi:hypothetical protein